MNNPKISIIFVFNDMFQGALRNLLDSLVNQTYEFFEVIIIDNFSNQKNSLILEEYQKYPFFRITKASSQPPLGICYNMALDMVTTDYFILANYQCYFQPKFLNSLYSTILLFPDIDMIMPVKNTSSYFEYYTPLYLEENQICMTYNNYVWNNLYKKSTFLNYIPLFPENPNTSLIFFSFFFKSCVLSKKMVLIPDDTIYENQLRFDNITEKEDFTLFNIEFFNTLSFLLEQEKLQEYQEILLHLALKFTHYYETLVNKNILRTQFKEFYRNLEPHGLLYALETKASILKYLQ